MHRPLPVSRHIASNAGRQRLTIVRRRLTTGAGEEATKTGATKIVRKFVIYSTLLTGTFYVGSAFVAYNYRPYYDIVDEHIPFGHNVLGFGEANGWDNLTLTDVLEGTTGAVVSTYTVLTNLVSGTKSSSTETPDKTKKKVEEDTKPAALKVIKQTKAVVDSKAEPIVQQAKSKAKEVKKEVKEAVSTVASKVENAEASLKDKAALLTYEFEELIQRAESAISGKPYQPASVESPRESSAVEASSSTLDPIYSRPLPLGFEPPPGYSRPTPPKPKSTDSKSQTVSLPLIAPHLSDSSEPIISHLAGTIDNLAAFLKSDPKAASQAGDVLEVAKGDLAALVDRLETVKEQEKHELDTRMDELTREYNLKIIEVEIEAQDKLDHQEEGFKQLFESERAKTVQAYREKLDHELKVQTELINARLKEEVIAQGVELQRRWIREVKVRVEQERGGRLAKLEELSANLKRLEQIALDNSTYLDENIQVHALWSAFRALSNSATASPVRKPFREELRVLRHITVAREDPVVSVVLDSLEKTDVPDVGVEPFADLATWFTNEVAPKVSKVALVPDENAGVLSYLASQVISGLRFKRQGLTPGNDVLSVLARAEYYLNEKNLDSAARELNQLKGPAKVLLHDWLQAARQRLEVQQVLEVVHTQATLASLLVV